MKFSCWFFVLLSMLTCAVVTGRAQSTTAILPTSPWIKQPVNTTASLRGLSVVNEKVIWASGTGGTVIRTIDGGEHWKVTIVPDAEKLDFRDVEAFDANSAYILSIGNGNSSRIYKTIDGGKTWKQVFLNHSDNTFYDALACWDRNNCLAMADPVDGSFWFIKTEDGGKVWSPIATFRPATALHDEAAFAASGTCIFGQGTKKAFVVSGGTAAQVYRSNDRGVNWTVVDSPLIHGTAASGIFSIAMFDDSNGVIVGGNYEKPSESAGTMAFTVDGGKTWTAALGLSGYRSGVAYVNKNIVVAVGTNGSDITYDGGKTWGGLDKENYNSVQSKGLSATWAVGPNGRVALLPIIQLQKTRASN